MNRPEFLQAFADERAKSLRIKKYQAKDICKAVLDFLAEKIESEDRVYLYGLGTFKKVTKSAHRIGDVNNPGKTMIVPERTRTVFSKMNEGNEE